MNKKKIISFFVFLILVIWAIFYIKSNFNDFKHVAMVSPLYIIPLFILGSLFLYINGLILKYLTEPFNIFLNNKEGFSLSILTTLGNYITPFRAGSGIRAVYLKKRYNFSYSAFLCTLLAIYLLIFLVNSFIGLASLFLLYVENGVFNFSIFTLFFSIFTLLLFITIFNFDYKDTKYRIINKLFKVLNHWKIIKSNIKIISIISILVFFQSLVISLMMFLEFIIFGFKISFVSSLFLSVIFTLSLLISITPGALGIKETLTVFSAKLIGISPLQTLPVALLHSIIFIIIVFLLSPFCSYILLGKFFRGTNNIKIIKEKVHEENPKNNF